MEKKPNNKKSEMSKLSPPEKSHIEELLESAMKEYAVRQHKHIKDKEELASRIIGVVSEFLGPFMLIGYDTKGEPFNVFHISSQMDFDALTAAINKFIFNNTNNTNQ